MAHRPLAAELQQAAPAKDAPRISAAEKVAVQLATSASVAALAARCHEAPDLNAAVERNIASQKTACTGCSWHCKLILLLNSEGIQQLLVASSEH